MPMYLISYALSSADSPEHALLEDDITENIDAQAIKPTESTFLVKSSMSIDQLIDALLSHFKLFGDKLTIVDASKLHSYGGDGLVIVDIDKLHSYGGDGFRKYEVAALDLKFKIL